MKKWLANLSLFVGSCMVALVMAEFVSRYLLPISPGVERIDLHGRRIADPLTPGAMYRQVSTEYDALTTITREGHRVPQVKGNPDVIFLGDSFTFGQGLSDEETFPYIYCLNLGVACANLGTPGASTIEEVDILERALRERGWRPRQLKLFVFAMSSSFLGGNDLADNYFYVRRDKTKRHHGLQPIGEGGLSDVRLLERLLNYRDDFFLRYSNLLRVAKFYWGPFLRSVLLPELDQARLVEALEITRAQLVRLSKLSEDYRFDCKIYLIVPVQDILRGTHEKTLNDLQNISPFLIEGTAQLFRDDPKSYYFSYDGHLSKKGSRRIAEFLISKARVESQSQLLDRSARLRLDAI
jgi:hypothetical protein